MVVKGLWRVYCTREHGIYVYHMAAEVGSVCERERERKAARMCSVDKYITQKCLRVEDIGIRRFKMKRHQALWTSTVGLGLDRGVFWYCWSDSVIRLDSLSRSSYKQTDTCDYKHTKHSIAEVTLWSDWTAYHDGLPTNIEQTYIGQQSKIEKILQFLDIKIQLHWVEVSKWQIRFGFFIILFTKTILATRSLNIKWSVYVSWNREQEQ